MGLRGLGANGADAVTLFVALLLAGGSLLAPAAQTAPPPAEPATLVAAQLDDEVLTLRFSTAIDIGGPVESWLDFRRDGLPIAPWAGRSADVGVLEVAIPGGAYLGDEFIVAWREDTTLRGPDGAPLAPFPPIAATLTASRTGVPSFRGDAGLFALDGTAYVLGGFTGERATDQVVALDVATGVGRILPDPLPLRGGGGVAAFDPRSTAECPRGCAYLFGGWEIWPDDGAWGRTPEAHRWVSAITRFDPATGRSMLMEEELPFALAYAAASWGGDALYIFGGRDLGEDGAPAGGEYSSRIVRYDPIARDVRVLPTHLPWGLSRAGAVFDDRPSLGCPRGCAYVLGGWPTHALGGYDVPTNERPSDVLRFDPVTGAATPLPLRIDSGVALGLVHPVWTGEAAFFVGWPDVQRLALYRFDPEAGTLDELVHPDLPRRVNVAFVGGPDTALAIGGSDLLDDGTVGGWRTDARPISLDGGRPAALLARAAGTPIGREP